MSTENVVAWMADIGVNMRSLLKAPGVLRQGLQSVLSVARKELAANSPEAAAAAAEHAHNLREAARMWANLTERERVQLVNALRNAGMNLTEADLTRLLRRPATGK